MSERGEKPRAGRIGLVLILIVAAGALAFRLPRLVDRPMHGDEANQAVKAGTLLDTGVYTYDPVEHHGPTLYYLTLPVAWLSGQHDFVSTTEFTYRIVPLVFGVLVVLLLIPLRDTLGLPATLIAAALTALSPAMVYYSRYYIQEMLLVCVVFGGIVAGWRYAQTRSKGWAVAAGVFVGLAHASKETCILAFASMLAAAAGAYCLAVWRDRRALAPAKLIPPRHAIAFVLAALAVSVLFYSSFFTHPRGVLDSVLTYANYFRKADSGHIHDKPWYYYLQLLAFTKRAPWPWFSEGLILGLGTLGIIVALCRRSRDERPGQLDFLRFLAIYALLMTLAYALIPYKTPWCALNFLQPLIVLAGYGAVVLIRAMRFFPLRAVACVALVAGMAQLGVQAYRAVYEFPADPRNPYVYAHTAPVLLKLIHRVDSVSQFSPEGDATLIHVISPDGDYWPLPWYLRRHTQVGYWPEIPEPADAPIILAPSKFKPLLAPHLKDQYQSEFYALRPGVLWLMEIRKDLWDSFMKGRR
ncbi:MAG: TIGR03663 family protein [Candidatus Hydrogenedentes bacterium]|nr:TIGR03663 family protein [Candidatus Hydrogenedentota bacterium]